LQHDLGAWQAAVCDNTKLFYGEMNPNPKNNWLDITGVSEVAHANHVPLMVDNTAATPWLAFTHALTYLQTTWCQPQRELSTPGQFTSQTIQHFLDLWK
jgi:hypothetical protein